MPLSHATSLEEAGGISALIRAAKKEGQLNAPASLRHWAGFGGLIDGFEKKYGIKVVDDTPYANSQREIDDLKRYRGQDRAPDVLNLGDSFAARAARQNLLAEYRVAEYEQIPSVQKDTDARWYNNYGGYISIGCDASRIKHCPVSFADLLKPEYKGKVTLDSDPTSAGQGLASVFAAALAYGGSFDNVKPGIDFFAHLNKVGNYNQVFPTPSAIAKGETSIVIAWDFLNMQHTASLARAGVDWRVSLPFDGSFTLYYANAISRDAPHPAAARLWQEYSFSPQGQNLRLAGYARAVLMDAMADNGTLNKALAARLPTVEGTPTFPSESQLTKGLRTIQENWHKTVR